MNRADAPYVESLLTPGDLAASDGRWINAIDDWEQAMESSPSLAPQVCARIDWFLSRRDSAQPTTSPVRDNLHLMLLSLAAAIMAVAFVLLPETPGSTNANVFAVGAWILIVSSATLAIVVTQRIGDRGSDGSNQTTAKLARARHMAEMIDSRRQPAHE